jgi:hypothetical protein
LREQGIAKIANASHSIINYLSLRRGTNLARAYCLIVVIPVLAKKTITRTSLIKDSQNL